MLPRQSNGQQSEIRYGEFDYCMARITNILRANRSTETAPIATRNAYTGRKTKVILRCPGLPADNPQQSEQASHIGGNGNCKCRKCKVGGPRDDTESNEGYHAFYAVSIGTYFSTSRWYPLTGYYRLV